jgi:four helix bundle suffix protein
MTGEIIPPHGGYSSLLSFQKAEIVYDATVRFCAANFDRRDRTVDQMIQAARSGKQNIVEGSMASGTSRETELKLVNVARASLEELLTDYHDFLRSRGLHLWEKNSREALYVRKLSRGDIVPPEHMSHAPHASHETNGQTPRVTFETFRPFLETRSPEVVANIVICLIHQANYLLDQQIRRLEQTFLKEGGLRERMSRARMNARNNMQSVNERPLQ